MTYDVGARRTGMKSLCIVVGDLGPSHISTLPGFPEDGPSVSKPLTRSGEVSECFIPLPLRIVHGLLGSTRTVEDITSSLQVTVPGRDFGDIVVEPPFAQLTGIAIVQNKAEFFIILPLPMIGYGAFMWLVVNRDVHPGNFATFWRCRRCLCLGHRTAKPSSLREYCWTHGEDGR